MTGASTRETSVSDSERPMSRHPPRWPWLAGIAVLMALIVFGLARWGGELTGRLAGALDEGASGIGLFVAVYLVGVAISITPCVYPVIPITVSYIGARTPQSRTKSFLLSLAYVLGMATAYFVIGAVIAVAAAASETVFFGDHQNNPWLIFGVANLLIVFGMNMMGAFELRLPSFMTRNRATAVKKKGGYTGAFLVGGASALVVGSCTGAAIVAMLALITREATAYTGRSLFAYTWFIARGGSIMFVFALGLGTLILLAGTFAGLLTSLPKPGSWMDNVKKGFGVLMAALGGLFLVSMAQTTGFPELWGGPWARWFAGAWGVALLMAAVAAAAWLASWIGFMAPKRQGASRAKRALWLAVAVGIVAAAELFVIDVAQHADGLAWVAEIFSTSL